MHCSTSLEAERRRSKGWQGRCLLRAGREKLWAPPLAPGAFRAPFGVLGLEVRQPRLCLHLHGPSPRVHVCILTSPFYKDSHAGQGACLLQLPNPICINPRFTRWLHSGVLEVRASACEFGGDRNNLTPNSWLFHKGPLTAEFPSSWEITPVSSLCRKELGDQGDLPSADGSPLTPRVVTVPSEFESI